MFKDHRRLLGVVVASVLVLAACTSGTADNGDPSTTQAAAATTTSLPAVDTTPRPAPATTTMETTDPADLEDQIGLYSAMRTLWSVHMQWTYATVDAFFHNQEGLQAQLDRLLANQADIGAALASFYGDEAGNQLTELLTTHINQAVPVLTAAQAGDTAALETALADWYSNAEEIADFVSAANPENWPQSATRPMLEGHIDTTVVYATDLLGGDYTSAVEHFDEASHHMMMLADTLAVGIIAQFPDQFGG
jgi:hypothetical protein